jgi:hypothetical protein
MKLSPKAKADAGLSILGEAILELIRQKGRPMQPTEVRDELRWSPEWGGAVAMEVMKAMLANKLLEATTDKQRPAYAIVPESKY